MKTPRHSRRKQSESGVALLIAIFALMLISAVAITLIVASGSESSLAGNYRSSTRAYYAGFAGLEEGRGRVLPSNPNYINPAAGLLLLPVGTLRYIVNPAPGELAGLALLATYPDTEYDKEFGVGKYAAAIKTTTNSVSTVAGVQGPLYKWVRINAATERSIGIDVNRDSNLNGVTPLFYDQGLTPPSLIVPLNPLAVPATARQALEVTALAVLPDGSQKIVQYVTAPKTYDFNFPSALTLSGKNINYSGANSNVYFDNGTDGSGNPPAVPGCSTNPSTSLPAIGVTEPLGGTTNKDAVVAGLPRPDHYLGGGLPTPSVSDTITLSPDLQTPASLDALVKDISDTAIVVTPPGSPGTATQADLPPMSATNPQTVVVNGNLSLNAFVGYGLLVVTGNFSYDGNSGWKGIVLVVGDGTTTFTGAGGGNQEFDGAIFVAAIKDTSGNLLSQVGTVNFNISGGGGNGVYYNSCWIQRSKPILTYQVLSFREISQ